MAANSTTKNQTTENPARKLTTYDLVIGILAIFSLIILIPLIFGNVDTLDKRCPKHIRNLPVRRFSLRFLSEPSPGPKEVGLFLKGGGWLDLLGSIPFMRLPFFALPACSESCVNCVE